MGLKESGPALFLSLGVTILLALVSFNTPILKSFYFLSATYTDGSIDGSIKLGTMGYCWEYAFENVESMAGGMNCTGPTIGYQFGKSRGFINSGRSGEGCKFDF